MTEKLSHLQIEVLQLMKDGWELGTGYRIYSSVVDAEGRSCRGGESKGVHNKTVWALLEKGLIRINSRSFRYELTEKGKDENSQIR